MEECQLGAISNDFNNFEIDIENKIMGLQYLQNYQQRLYPYLTKLFHIKKKKSAFFLIKNILILQ